MMGLGIRLMENLLLFWNRSHLVWMWGMSWASQMDWTWLEVLPGQMNDFINLTFCCGCIMASEACG